MSIVGFDYFGRNNTILSNAETRTFNSYYSKHDTKNMDELTDANNMWPTGSTTVNHSLKELLPPIGVICGCPPTGMPFVFSGMPDSPIPPLRDTRKMSGGTARMKWSGDNAIDIPYDEGIAGNRCVVYLTIQPSYRALFKITFEHHGGGKKIWHEVVDGWTTPTGIRGGGHSKNTSTIWSGNGSVRLKLVKLMKIPESAKGQPTTLASDCIEPLTDATCRSVQRGSDPNAAWAGYPTCKCGCKDGYEKSPRDNNKCLPTGQIDPDCGNNGWRGQWRRQFGKCACMVGSEKWYGGKQYQYGTFHQRNKWNQDTHQYDPVYHTVPDGDTWCITPEKVCADNEEAHLDWNLNWKCEPIMGCMDKYSVHYNPNAVKTAGSLCGGTDCAECGKNDSACLESCGETCIQGTSMKILGTGDGSCNKLLDSFATVKNGRGKYNKYALAESGHASRWRVIQEINIHDVANPTGSGGGYKAFNNLADATAYYNELKGDSIVKGCTNNTATNYDQDANQDDGSCEGAIIRGCMDENADNYNSAATEDDDSCEYAARGCMDSTATNYNPNATEDDDSCTYADETEIVSDGLPTWTIPAGIVGALAVIMMIAKK